jgi:hypothetical protein
MNMTHPSSNNQTATVSVHLLAFNPEATHSAFLDKVDKDSILIKGRAHGWVHRPHRASVQEGLLGREWDLLLVSKAGGMLKIPGEYVAEKFSIQIQIPGNQFDDLLAQVKSSEPPGPDPQTLALPGEWTEGGIPESAISISDSKGKDLEVGELRLDEPMADFLRSALPEEVRDKPCVLFNLFKYKNNDRSVHDGYMEDFKQGFGDSAGARVKFMGPIVHQDDSDGSRVDGNGNGKEGGKEGQWDDANLVQYDSLWHYAYMLSTEFYGKLNKTKVAGLEDTGILCVSEGEIWG